MSATRKRTGALKVHYHPLDAVTVTDFTNDIDLLDTYGQPAYALWANTAGDVVVYTPQAPSVAVKFTVGVPGTPIPFQVFKVGSSAHGTTITSLTVMFPEAR